MPIIIFDADFTDLRVYCLNSALISVDVVLKIAGKWNSAKEINSKILGGAYPLLPQD